MLLASAEAGPASSCGSASLLKELQGVRWLQLVLRINDCAEVDKQRELVPRRAKKIGRQVARDALHIAVIAAVEENSDGDWAEAGHGADVAAACRHAQVRCGGTA